MYPKIIGLLGRSRSGKDTVASIIQSIYPQCNYTIVRLSTPIKEAAKNLFAFEDKQIEGHEKEELDQRWGITPRQVFQVLTNDVMKYMGKDFFTRLLYEKYDKGSFGENIIIPDIRYEHDIQEIKKRNGIVIKIERDNLPIKYACEDHLDKITYLPTIKNNDTTDQLPVQIKKIVKKISSTSTSRPNSPLMLPLPSQSKYTL